MSESQSDVSAELISSFRRKNNKRESCSQTDTDIDKVIEMLEKDLNKLRVENIRLEKTVKQNQENLALYSANQNNTSSNFMLPSEFKSKWENMIKSLPDSFITLFEHPILFVYAVQSLCLFIQEKIKSQLNIKIKQICEILGIKCSPHQQLMKIFQDNYQEVLICHEEIINDFKPIIEAQLNECLSKYNHISETSLVEACKNDWVEGIDNDDMKECCKTLWSLISFITLSDLELSLGFEQVHLDFVNFKKNEFYCIDGFGKEGCPSLVVLPSIKRQQTHIYYNIKQGVLILPTHLYELETKHTDVLIVQQETNIEMSLKMEDLEISQFQIGQQQTENHSIQLQDNSCQIFEVNNQDDSRIKTEEESRPFISTQVELVDEVNEFRIKPCQQKQKSFLQEMKDTLQFNKVENSLSFQQNKDKETERSYYMQRMIRTQNSRIEENSSFLGKANNSLAGKIVHQKSIHQEDNQRINMQQLLYTIQSQKTLQQATHTKIFNKKVQNKENISDKIKTISKLSKYIFSKDEPLKESVEKKNSLEKLMKSFCLSQRNNNFSAWQHKRAQSNEHSKQSKQNQQDKVSSDEDEDTTQHNFTSFLQKTLSKNKQQQLKTQNVIEQIINSFKKKRILDPTRCHDIKTSQFLYKLKLLDANKPAYH